MPFSSWNRLSLPYRLIAVMTTGILVLVLGLTTFFWQVGQQNFKVEFEQQTELLTTNYLSVSRHNLLEKDLRFLQQFTEDFIQQNHLVSAQVYDSSGSLVVSSPGAPSILNMNFESLPQTKQKFSWREPPEVIVITRTVFAHQQKLGVLRLEVSTKPLLQSLHEFQDRLIIVSILAITTGISLVSTLALSVERSLHRVARVIKKIANSDPSITEDLETISEFEILIASLKQVNSDWDIYFNNLVTKTENLECLKTRQKDFLDNIPDILLLLNSQGLITEVKIPPQEHYSLQDTVNDAVNHDLHKLFPLATVNAFNSAIERVIQNREIQKIEFEWFIKNRRCYFEARFMPCSQDRILVILRDNTESKIAFEEFKRVKQKAEISTVTREKFLANMSHELRTPLNGILGLSDLLLAEAKDSGYTEIVSDLQQIQDSGTHLLTLIEDILDVSQQETEKASFNPERFDLATLILEVRNLVQPLLKKNHNSLVLEERQDTGAMFCDRKRVKQILFHLLSNAAKFTHQGTITINVRRQTRDFMPALLDTRQLPVPPQESAIFAEAPVPAFSDRQVPAKAFQCLKHLDSDWIIFEISDTGIGMSQQEIEQAFDAFNQGELGTTKKYPGAGLGLTVCKSSCEMMGGNIRVTSTPDQGSTFTFWLPATLVTAP